MNVAECVACNSQGFCPVLDCPLHRDEHLVLLHVAAHKNRNTIN